MVKLKIVKIKYSEIVFNNGYKLEYHHERDCCEEVYADFSILETYNVSTKTGKNISIYDIDFCENLKDLIEGKKDCGFNLISKIGEKFFVPCYNEQNGYYSDKLELILHKNNETEKIDITDFVEDKIY